MSSTASCICHILNGIQDWRDKTVCRISHAISHPHRFFPADVHQHSSGPRLALSPALLAHTLCPSFPTHTVPSPPMCISTAATSSFNAPAPVIAAALSLLSLTHTVSSPPAYISTAAPPALPRLHQRLHQAHLPIYLSGSQSVRPLCFPNAVDLLQRLGEL
jgi:hypothetical protein